MPNRNIVLCGFMGCGKSTLGPLAADLLLMRFIDADSLIEAEAGISIKEIFETLGEEYFRGLEHDIMTRLGFENGLVIATGGGALTIPRNIPPLKKNGLIIFIDPGFEECFKRIEKSDRPLVKANSREALRKMYETRKEAYIKASDIRLRMSGEPEHWADAIAKLALDTSETGRRDS